MLMFYHSIQSFKCTTRLELSYMSKGAMYSIHWWVTAAVIGLALAVYHHQSQHAYRTELHSSNMIKQKQNRKCQRLSQRVEGILYSSCHGFKYRANIHTFSLPSCSSWNTILTHHKQARPLPLLSSTLQHETESNRWSNKLKAEGKSTPERGLWKMQFQLITVKGPNIWLGSF